MDKDIGIDENPAKSMKVKNIDSKKVYAKKSTSTKNNIMVRKDKGRGSQTSYSQP